MIRIYRYLTNGDNLIALLLIALVVTSVLRVTVGWGAR